MPRVQRHTGLHDLICIRPPFIAANKQIGMLVRSSYRKRAPGHLCNIKLTRQPVGPHLVRLKIARI